MDHKVHLHFSLRFVIKVVFVVGDVIFGNVANINITIKINMMKNIINSSAFRRTRTMNKRRRKRSTSRYSLIYLWMWFLNFTIVFGWLCNSFLLLFFSWLGAVCNDVCYSGLNSVWNHYLDVCMVSRAKVIVCVRVGDKKIVPQLTTVCDKKRMKKRKLELTWQMKLPKISSKVLCIRKEISRLQDTRTNS